MSEMKAGGCPFCGYNGDKFEFRGHVVRAPGVAPTRVVSLHCVCGATSGYGLTPESCRAGWLSRPREEALQALLTEADDAIKTFLSCSQHTDGFPDEGIGPYSRYVIDFDEANALPAVVRIRGGGK